MHCQCCKKNLSNIQSKTTQELLSTQHKAIKATSTSGYLHLAKSGATQKAACMCKRLVCSRLAIKNVQ